MDTLDDPWESALAGDQLAHVLSQHPTPNVLVSMHPNPTLNDLRALIEKSAIDRARRMVNLWRQTTFVNCWCASDHKVLCSVAHILRQGRYCHPNTFEGLDFSAAGLGVHTIDYGPIGEVKRTPTRLDLVTKKRLMFDYEREVKIVLGKEEFEAVLGHTMDWDPSTHVNAVFLIQKLTKRSIKRP